MQADQAGHKRQIIQKQSEQRHQETVIVISSADTSLLEQVPWMLTESDWHAHARASQNATAACTLQWPEPKGRERIFSK